MADNLKNKGMSLRRIIVIEMVLLIAAQLTITSIGLYYTVSINKSIHKHRTGLMMEQFTQNVSLQINDTNNLLTFLSMSDISYYFQNFMALREKSVVEKEEERLIDKLEALQLSPDIIESIYFIGNDKNQKTCRKTTGIDRMDNFYNLRIETLEKVRLKNLFYSSQNQFVRYSLDDFMAECKPDNPTITTQERDELEKFLQDLDGHMFITTVYGQDNINVLIIVVLGDQFFRQALPQEQMNNQTFYTLLHKNGKMLWSTCNQSEILQTIETGADTTSVHGGVWNHSSREIPFYNLRIVYSEKKGSSFLNQYGFLKNMLLIVLGTLTLSFIFSFLYLKMMLKPFRLISHAIDAQTKSNDRVMSFHPIASSLLPRGFHRISLRNKLIILFYTVICILISSNSVFFVRMLNQKVNDWVTESVEDVGSFAAAGLNNQVQYFENLANQISLSENLQNYLMKNLIDARRAPLLKTFPGLNDISYIVLLDARGVSMYSSVYSNNSDIFDIASTYLREQSEPYWIYNYNNVLKDVYTGVMRKIEFRDPSAMLAYLLIVPKESAFSIAETERFMSAYIICNSEGQVLYRQGYMTAENERTAGRLRYQQPLKDSDWTVTIDYIIPEVATLEKAYQDRFYFSIIVVSLFSVWIVMRISSVLTQSIQQLRDEMRNAEIEGKAHPLDFDSQDEISDIINSYNRMIARLEETVRENMRMMEENAQNKIREKELLSMKARAEINMLQTQINPHFLNNTLFAISLKSTRQGNMEISHIVNALSGLLRYSMVITPDTAPLEQEINHATNYVTIQQMCYGNSFTVRFDIPGELYEYSVPRVILQPLIENSILHGFEGWESGGEILISAREKDGMLQIRVCDNGVGMDAETLEKIRSNLDKEGYISKTKRHGIGLQNVYHRIKLRYQDRSKMTIESALMKGTEIRMIFPAEMSNLPESNNFTRGIRENTI